MTSKDRIPVYTHKFPGGIEIVNLGDVHLANELCDRAMLHRVVEYIKEGPNRYWLSTGDLMEVAVPGFPGAQFATDLPGKELDKMIGIIEPIAKKCLGLTHSNHPARTLKAAGLNLDKVLCNQLGLLYLGQIGLLQVVCDRAAYYLVLHHGFGGGRQTGTKINNMQELASVVPGGDIYLFGHTHTFSIVPNITYPVDKKRQLCLPQMSYYVTTGHYINYPGSYAEEKLMRPKPKGSALLKLRGCGVGNKGAKRVDVELCQG